MVADQKAIFEQTFEINRRLADVALNGGGLLAIAQKLSDALGTPVIIEDASWIRITARMPDRLAPEFGCERLLAQLTGAFLPYYEREGLLEQLDNGKCVVWSGLPKKQVKARVVAPIFVDKKVQGYISVLNLDGPPNELEILACEQAAIVAALELSKERAVAQTRFRMERDVLQELVSGYYDQPQLIQRRLAMLGWDLDRPTVAITFELYGVENVLFNNANFEPNKLDAFKECVLRKGRNLVDQRDPQAIVTFLGDSNLTVIANPAPQKPPSKEDCLSLIKEILAAFAASVPEVQVKVGLGGFSRHVMEVSRSYSQARQALQIGLTMMPETDIYCYEDLGLYKLLFNLAGTRELQEFCQETIEPLIEHDRKNNSDYYHTLEYYLESNGSVSQTADELFIHRNTLNYRLRRIEEILGQNLSDSETRLKLLLALRIKRIILARDARQAKG